LQWSAHMKSQDPTTLLKKDHAKVKKLFEAFEESGDRALKLRTSLYEQIREELTIHATIEEEIFYPAVNAARSKDAKKMVAEANEEHALVKQLLAELGDLEAGDIQFSAKMKVMKDLVLHHAKEEEKEMFKEAKEDLSEVQLDELGARMAARKEALMNGGLPAEKPTDMAAMDRPNGRINKEAN